MKTYKEFRKRISNTLRTQTDFMKLEFNLAATFLVPINIGICFFDQGKLVVLANGFKKKTQKTPKKEIEMALKIKGEYESEK